MCVPYVHRQVGMELERAKRPLLKNVVKGVVFAYSRKRRIAQNVYAGAREFIDRSREQRDVGQQGLFHAYQAVQRNPRPRFGVVEYSKRTWYTRL